MFLSSFYFHQFYCYRFDTVLMHFHLTKCATDVIPLRSGRRYGFLLQELYEHLTLGNDTIVGHSSTGIHLHTRLGRCLGLVALYHSHAMRNCEYLTSIQCIRSKVRSEIPSSSDFPFKRAHINPGRTVCDI